MEHEAAIPGIFSLAPLPCYLFGLVQLVQPKSFVNHQNIPSPTDYLIMLYMNYGLPDAIDFIR